MKIGRRGSITTHLTVIGKQGHIAYPLEALNPATPIIKILDELKSKALDKGNKNFQPSNLEITKISIDNSADNVIPAKASATFNIRYNTLHTFSSLKKYISKIIKKYEKKYKCKTQIQFQGTGTAFLTKPNQTVKKIQSIIKKETKQNTVLSTIGGTSDARFIKDIASCIEFGLVGNTMHQVDERSSIKDMKKLKSIYLKIIKKFLIENFGHYIITYQNHDTGPGHPEGVDRVKVVNEELKKLDEKIKWFEPKLFDHTIIEKVHNKNYLEKISIFISKNEFNF